jgi:4'-phosphopantetheinyl transferase
MRPAGTKPDRKIVRLWRWTLDAPPHSVEQFWQVLSPDERDRADRRATRLLRNRAIAARGGLRCALARHLDCTPAELRFFHGFHGKPMLADSLLPLHFNLSHSGELALLGVSRDFEIGVDVERLGAMPEDLLAVLAPAETHRLMELQPVNQARGFFDCWTRKEAYVKATGLGMSIPFDSFDVLSAPGGVRMHQSPGNADCGRWRIQSLTPADGYIGAVAAGAGSVGFSLELTDLF